MSRSALFAVIEHYGGPNRDKSLDWWEWLCLNFPEGPPEELGEAWEIIPDEIRAEVELFYARLESAKEQ